MKSKKKSIYLEVFSRLRALIIYLVSVLFIISSSIFVFYYTNEQLEFSDINLSHISGRLEQYFTSTKHYTRLLLNSKTVQRGFSIYYNDRDSFSTQKPAMSFEINKFTYPAPYIYSISIYDKAYNILISSERKLCASKFDGEIVGNGRFILSQKYDINTDKLIPVFSYIQPCYNYMSGALFGYIEIAISEKSIENIYEITSDEASLYMILDENYNILSSSNFFDNRNKLKNHIISSLKNSDRKHIFTPYAFINVCSLLENNWRLVHVIPIYSLIKPALSIASVFLFIAAIYLIVALLFSKKVSINITKPIYALIKHIQLVKEGRWQKIDYISDLPEMNLLIKDFNGMIIAQNDLKNKILNIEKIKNKLELDRINEQIKPHFLYNTLDNIYALASLNEKETLLKLVMDLSKFYRGCLSLGRSFVAIKDEIETCRAYLEIMKVRYHDKFDYEIICDTKLNRFLCPKLIILPLIENSIYHGIKALKSKGIILIKIDEEEAFIKISVIDNGMDFDIEKIKEILRDKSYRNQHFALKHINQLLKIYYGEETGLTFEKECDKNIVAFKIGKEPYNEN